MSQQIHQKPQETIAFPMSSIALTTLHPATQGLPLPKIGTLIPNRIFVGGINSNTTEDELRNFFSVFGPIKDVKVIYDKSGLSKGSYGFVTFEDQETAEAIIKNGAETLIFKERKLNIGYAVRKQHILPKQELGGTLLLAHNPCNLSNGLQLLQFCPHDSVITMNPSAVCYPATVMITPNMGSHDLFTVFSGSMHNATQPMQHATSVVKPGSTPCTTKGMVCPHLAPTTRSIPLGCTVMSNRTPGHSVCVPGGTCLASEQCDTKTDIVHGGLHSQGHNGNHSEPKQDIRLPDSKMGGSSQQPQNGRSSLPSELIGPWIESHGRHSNPNLAKSFSESMWQSVRHNSDSLGHLIYGVSKDTSPVTSTVHFTDNQLSGPSSSRTQPIDNVVITCCHGTSQLTTTPIVTRSTLFTDRQPSRMNTQGESDRKVINLSQPDCVLRNGQSKDSAVGMDVSPIEGESPARIQVPNFELKLEPIMFGNIISDRQWPNRIELSRGKEELGPKGQTQMDIHNHNGNVSSRRLDHMLRQYQWPSCHSSESSSDRAHNLSNISTGESNQMGSTLQCLSGSGILDVCSTRLHQMNGQNGRNCNVKTTDEHDRCIRRLLMDSVLSERSLNLEFPGRMITERNTIHNNFTQVGRSSKVMCDEDHSQYQFSGPTQQFVNKSSFTDSERIYYPQPFTPSLAHKGCLADEGTEHLYEDDIRHADLDSLLFGRKTPGIQGTNGDPLTKMYEPSEDAISRENCTDSFVLMPETEVETMPVEKLDSVELRSNSLTTNACGDISKQRSS